MKNKLFIIAALCGFFFVQNSYATCSNYKTFTDGSVLTAGELNSLQTNYTNCINGVLDGDIFTGNVNLYSGADLNMYSDTGTTLKFTVDGATGSFGIPSGQKFYVDGTALTGDTYFSESSANTISFFRGGTEQFKMSSGVNNFLAGNVYIAATNALYLDGGSNTYIYESSADVMNFVVGGASELNITSARSEFGGDIYIPSTNKFYLDGGTDDYIRSPSDGRVGIYSKGNDWLYVATDGVHVSGAPLIITSGQKVYYDTGGDTYDIETTANVLDRYVGGVLGFRLDATADPLFPSHDTTASGANAYLDSATGELMRSTSSIKYKENVEDLEIDTAKIYELRAVSYDDKQENAKEVEDTSLTHKRYFGLIAEEVDKVIPQLVDHNSVTGDPEYVFYDRLSVLLLKEVQKLKAENDDMKSRLLAAGL